MKQWFGERQGCGPGASGLSGGGPRRWGPIMAGIWLVYLSQPLDAAWDKRDTAHGVLGIVVTAAFAAVYLGTFFYIRGRAPIGPPVALRPFEPRLAAPIAVMAALAALSMVFIGESGLTCMPFIAVMVVLWLPRNIWGLVAGFSIGAIEFLLSVTVPGWTAQAGVFFGTCVATLAVWGLAQAMLRAMEVTRVREDNARLEIEEERNRFARDLHDILGHSLTVVTVKAELAGRLIDADPERAKAEIADLERLSRDALADVRRAVAGYREITLPGELARARVALDAAQIEADLPTATDHVASELREAFAWVIREGVTNVIRHSGAKMCTIRFSEREVEVRDDGTGALPGHPGTGLLGLRERAVAVSGTLVTETLAPGFSLKLVA